MSERSEKAEALFKSGYNCSQSVFAAYADIFGIDTETALKISCGLGGGCGRQRELCGAVSGAVLAIGMKYGTTDGADTYGKKLSTKRCVNFLMNSEKRTRQSCAGSFSAFLRKRKARRPKNAQTPTIKNAPALR